MATHNFRAEQAAALKSLRLTADHTLTVDELQEFGAIVALEDCFTLTLPAASKATQGLWFVLNNRAGEVLVAIAGSVYYGGSEDAGDSMVYLTRGDLGIIVGDGDNWHATPAVCGGV